MNRYLVIALALLVLPFSLVFAAGTAIAAPETEKTLTDRLLTTEELKAALGSNGVTLDFAGPSLDIRDSDINLPELVGAGRLWGTSDDSGLVDILLSYKDGRDIPAEMKAVVLNGDMAKGFLGTIYKKVDFKGKLEDKSLGPNEAIHLVEGTDEAGKVEQVAVVSFVRGNIFGMTLYATADNQLTEAISAFGGQTAKLPN